MIFEINDTLYPTVKEVDLAHKLNLSDNKTICIIIYTDSLIEMKDYEKKIVSININNSIFYNKFYIRNIYYDDIFKKYTIYGEEK